MISPVSLGMDKGLYYEYQFASRCCRGCGVELEHNSVRDMCRECNTTKSHYRRACTNFMRWGILQLWERGGKARDYNPRLLVSMLRYRGCLASTREIFTAVAAHQDRYGLPVISLELVPADCLRVREAVSMGVGGVRHDPLPRRSSGGVYGTRKGRYARRFDERGRRLDRFER